MLFAHLGDRDFVQQMLAENFDLLFGTELSAAVGWFDLLIVAHAISITQDRQTEWF